MAELIRIYTEPNGGSRRYDPDNRREDLRKAFATRTSYLVWERVTATTMNVNEHEGRIRYFMA
jgi:hypothetical protein